MAKLPQLGYEERQAINTLRKFIQRKPEHTKALLEALFPKDAGKELAVQMLLTGRQHLDSMLVATRGMMTLAKHFADSEKSE